MNRYFVVLVLLACAAGVILVTRFHPSPPDSTRGEQPGTGATPAQVSEKDWTQAQTELRSLRSRTERLTSELHDEREKNKRLASDMTALLDQLGKAELKSVVERAPNGQVVTRGQTLNGQKYGTWTTWYDTGVMESEGPYLEGKKTGGWTHWAKDGTVFSRGSYLNDQAEGVWEFRQPDGNMTQAWYSNGQAVDHP